MQDWVEPTAERLIQLYERPFGGKHNGRFRISAKHLRQLSGRRRLHESDISDLCRTLYQSGFILIDLDTFYVVTSSRTFNNYRRVGEACLA